MSGRKRTLYNNEALAVIERNLKAMLRIVKETRNGMSMAEAMRQEKMDLFDVRASLKSVLGIKMNGVRSDLKMKHVDDMLYTPVERVYKDIFEYTDIEWLQGNVRLPDDAEKTLKCVMAQLTEREQRCIELYYVEELTHEAIGKQFNVTRSRVAQIINNALRKMRNPSRANILKLGLNEYNSIIKEMAQVQKEVKNKYIQEVKDLTDEKYATGDIVLEKSIDALELDTRAYNCLRRAGCKTVKDVFIMNDSDLIEMRSLGRKSVEDIKSQVERYMWQHGFSLPDTICLKSKLLGRDLTNRLWEDYDID